MINSEGRINFPRVAHGSGGRQKVLFVRYSSIGDILLTAHISRALKEKFPDFELTWLVEDKYVLLAPCMPWFDHIISWDRKHQSFFDIAGRIRRENFDMYFNLQDNDRSALLGVLTGIRCRIGYHPYLQFLYQEEVHEVLAKVGIPLLPDHTVAKSLETPHIPSPLTQFLKRYPDAPCVALAIGASTERKCWPVEHWLKLIRALLKRDCTVVLLGAGTVEKQKAAFLESSAADERVFNLCDKISLTELLRVIADISFLVAADTGPLHMARTLGKKVVAMFGPTSLAYSYTESLAKVVFTSCKKMGCLDWSCTLPCMERITPEEVIAAAYELLDEKD